MLEEIGEKENAEPYLRALLERGERIMGFGHRVYRTKDPRAVALGSIAKQLLGNEKSFELALHVEEVALRLLREHKPGREIHTNVEFYAAAVLGAVGLEPSLFTPTFAVSRLGGWVAHILEQAQESDIIRPLALYTGPRR